MIKKIKKISIKTYNYLILQTINSDIPVEEKILLYIQISKITDFKNIKNKFLNIK